MYQLVQRSDKHLYQTVGRISLCLNARSREDSSKYIIVAETIFLLQYNNLHPALATYATDKPKLREAGGGGGGELDNPTRGVQQVLRTFCELS